MAYGTRATFDAVRELAFGSISASYAALGSAFTDHVRWIRIVNTCDTQMYISTDGSTDNIRMAANSFLIIDLSTNKIRDDGLFLPVGTQLYVKQVTAPMSGAVWAEVIYGAGGV